MGIRGGGVADYGFVDMRGRLLSLPALWEESSDGENEGLMTAGESTLTKRGDTWEVCGQQLRDGQVGAYAITVGQTRRRIDFRSDIPMCRRLYLRLKIWKRADWQ